MNMEFDVDKFWSRTAVGDDDECWEWQAGFSGDYGWFSDSGFERYAHRVSYRIDRGEWPEDQVNHTCHNPACVNPSHLYGGSHSDNMKDAYENGTQSALTHRGEQTNTAKLTEDDVREIRNKYDGDATQVELAEEYGVTQANISLIVRGEKWSHVE